MDTKKVIIGSDHAGFEYKKRIVQFLTDSGYEVLDVGANSADSVDYPDYIHPLAERIEGGEVPQGIIICGSGNGVAMTANKHQGIRAALSWNEELAMLARKHNDANVLAIPARFVSLEKAEAMVKVFLETAFEGGRHERRVRKIDVRC